MKVGFCGLDISVLRLDFMNKVPVCSFSDAKIRHLFGAVQLIATYCDLLRLSRA